MRLNLTASGGFPPDFPFHPAYFTVYDAILAVIEGSSPRERLLLVAMRPEIVPALRPVADDAELPILSFAAALAAAAKANQPGHLELRQQSWGDGVGWFTQHTIRIGNEQISGLRAALGAGNAHLRQGPPISQPAATQRLSG